MGAGTINVVHGKISNLLSNEPSFQPLTFIPSAAVSLLPCNKNYKS